MVNLCRILTLLLTRSTRDPLSKITGCHSLNYPPSLLLFCYLEDFKKSCLSFFTEQRQKILLAEETSVQQTGKIGDHAPVWVKDEDVTMCMTCAQRFGMVMRKHHCRGCGRVSCYNVKWLDRFYLRKKETAPVSGPPIALGVRTSTGIIPCPLP